MAKKRQQPGPAPTVTPEWSSRALDALQNLRTLYPAMSDELDRLERGEVVEVLWDDSEIPVRVRREGRRKLVVERLRLGPPGEDEATPE